MCGAIGRIKQTIHFSNTRDGDVIDGPTSDVFVYVCTQLARPMFTPRLHAPRLPGVRCPYYGSYPNPGPDAKREWDARRKTTTSGGPKGDWSVEMADFVAHWSSPDGLSPCFPSRTAASAAARPLFLCVVIYPLLSLCFVPSSVLALQGQTHREFFIYFSFPPFLPNDSGFHRGWTL